MSDFVRKISLEKKEIYFNHLKKYSDNQSNKDNTKKEKKRKVSKNKNKLDDYV